MVMLSHENLDVYQKSLDFAYWAYACDYEYEYGGNGKEVEANFDF